MMFRRQRKKRESPRQRTLSELSHAERDYVARQLAAAHIIVTRYVGDADSPPSLEQLDSMITAWLADGTDDRLDINVVVNATGVALGSYLSSEIGFDWVIAEDRGGTELALHSRPGDVVMYPANMVAKRLAKGESGFLVRLASAVVRDTRALSSRS